MASTSGFGTEEYISLAPSPPPEIASNKAQPEAGPSRHTGATSKNGSSAAGLSSAAGKKGKKRKAGDRDGDSTGPQSLKDERLAAERDCPWSVNVDWDRYNNPAQMLNAEVDAYYRFMAPTKAEFEVRLLMIEAVCRAIKREWPRAEIRPFGSWQTQLYLPQGDIDLVVSHDMQGQYIPKVLGRMAQAVRRANLTDQVAIIAKAKVPIIKFVTTEGRINVDISVNQVNGLSAGSIINTYLDSIPAARPLIMVVKAFLSQRSLNEVFTGGVGSYSVICMVVSFLQIHPKLHRDYIDAEQNLGVLLMEFFELYGRNFNYDQDGISLLRGGQYYRKMRKGFYNSQRPFLLSIEDPQQPGNDISVGSYGIRQVRQAFSGAHDMLQARLFERVDQILSRQTGKSKARWVPSEMSILSAIMGATKEMAKHRARMEDLHASGRLHHMLKIDRNADLRLHVSNYRAQHVKAPRNAVGPSTGTSADRTDGTKDDPIELDLDPSSDRETSPYQAAMKAQAHARKGDARSGGSSSSSKAKPSVLAVIMDDQEQLEEGEYAMDEEEHDDPEGDSFIAPTTNSTSTSAFAARKNGLHDDKRRSDNDINAKSTFRSVSAIDVDNGTSSAEEGEIVEMSPEDFPSRGGKRSRSSRRLNGRYESVSHAEDDYDILELPVDSDHVNDTDPDDDSDDDDERSADDGEELDSRYTRSSKKEKRDHNQIVNARQTGGSAKKRSDSSSSSASDEATAPTANGMTSASTSIWSAPAPAPTTAAATVKLSRKERRDFWAAKAGKRSGIEDGDGDGDGFVGFD